MSVTIGTQLGSHKITALLGKGGMGEVYLAFDTRLKRNVALKLLPAQYTQDLDRVRRFQQEAETASKLNHPSIITIHEIGQADGLYYLVTEYIEGQTLRERIQQSRLKVRETLDIAIQIAGALAEAHKANIIHRDIKPENVMVRRDGLVKVLDFGLAKLTDPQTFSQADAQTRQDTDSGVVAGTVQYMSPEQARGEKLDGRTDIFSLGAVLYEMIGGVSPFGGGSNAEVFARILEREPASLLQHAPDVLPDLEQMVRKTLRKNRDERYQSASELQAELSDLKRKLDAGIEKQQTQSAVHPLVTKPALLKLSVSIALGLLLLLGAATYFYRQPKPALTERDTILLSDFVNTTGDVVFDGALKQGLAVQLEQSPFLDVLSDARLRQTLRLMSRPPDGPITKDVAREICLRAGVKAFIVGSITPLGSHYVVGLEAMSSQTGEVIARQQGESASKEQVLKVLGEASRKLRGQLGESLSSIRKFDAPLEVTTSSLEALKTYSLGFALAQRGRFFDAIGFFRTAVEVDPNFGYAYDGLAVAYNNTQQTSLAKEPAERAFALRDRVTELEKLRITFFYYFNVTGELERAVEALELYRQAYPRDYRAPSNLANVLSMLGRYAKGVEAAEEALRLNSPSAATRVNLSENLRRLNRFAEAKEVSEAALQRGLADFFFYGDLYRIAFIEGDSSAMLRQLDAMANEPDAYIALDWQADAFAFQGQLHKSEDFSRRAVRQAIASGAKGIDFRYRAKAAFHSAVLSRCAEVRLEDLPTETDVVDPEGLEYLAVAFGLCGDEGGTQTLIVEMSKRFPKHTLVNALALPEAQAALALHRGQGQKAIEALDPTRRYEAAGEFRPPYIRALAYLQLRSGDRAAAEFQKILDHRGEAPLSVLYPLAQLGLARAEALNRDPLKARKAYEEFLTLWKDAEADLAPLQAGKREYQQLRSP